MISPHRCPQLLSHSVAITTCHSLLLYTSNPKTAESRIGSLKYKAKDASGGKLSREVIKKEIIILLMIFKSKWYRRPLNTCSLCWKTERNTKSEHLWRTRKVLSSSPKLHLHPSEQDSLCKFPKIDIGPSLPLLFSNLNTSQYHYWPNLWPLPPKNTTSFISQPKQIFHQCCFYSIPACLLQNVLSTSFRSLLTFLSPSRLFLSSHMESVQLSPCTIKSVHFFNLYD